MQRTATTALLLLLALVGPLAAQSFSEPTLSITDDTGQPGQTVCLPVSLHNLNDLTTIQGGLAWDTSALRFVGVELGGLPEFSSSDLNLESTDRGRLLYSWASESGLGVALADSALFLEVCFVVRSATPPGAYYVAFNDEIRPEVSVDLAEVHVDYHSGWVSVPGPEEQTLELDFILREDCSFTQTDLALTVNGGSPPYDIDWTGPYGFVSSADTLIALGATGVYAVTVTDQTGAVWTGTALYTEVNRRLDPTPIADVFLTLPGCTEPTGAIRIQTNGPVTDYDFAWSTGATTDDISGLAGGLYSVTVTRRSDGCSQERFFELYPDEEDVVLLAGANLELPDCATQSGGAITLIPAFPGLEFAWSNGATAAALTDLATGNYTVSVTNPNGCTEVRSFALDPPENFDLTLSQIDAACGTPSGELTAVVSNGPAGENYTYAWDTGATTPTIGELAAGNYTVTVSSGSGCVRVAEATVEQQAELLLDAAIEPVGCDTTGSVTLTVAPGAQITWGDGSAAAVYPVDTARLLEVTLLHPSGCEQDYSFSVPDFRPPFVPTAREEAPSGCIVPSGSISLDFSFEPFDYTYVWSDGPSGTSSSIQRSELAPGDYELYLTNPYGCADTLVFSVGTTGGFEVSADVVPVICETPGTIALGGPGAPDFSFAWASGETTASVTAADPGSYAVTVTSGQGCEETLTVDVPAETDDLAWNLGGIVDPGCGQANGSIELELENGTQATWSNGATGPVLSEVAAGTYFAYLATPNGCRDTLDFELQSGTELAVEPENVVLTPADCDGENGAIEVTFAAGTDLSYSWSTGATTTAITGLAAGTYDLTVSDASGCSAVFSYTLDNLSGFTLDLAVLPIGCDGEGSITATASGTANYAYAWNTGATTASLAVTTGGTYTVTVTDPATGCQRIESVAVAEPNLPRIDSLRLACEQATDCQGSIAVEVYLGGGSGTLTARWSDGVVTTGLTAFTSRLLPIGSTYAVTVTDGAGCTVAETDIEVFCAEPPPLRVVNYVECETDSSGPTPVLETFLVAEVLDARSIHTFAWSDGLTDTSYYRSRRQFDPGGADLDVVATDAGGVVGTNYIPVSDFYQCAEAASSLFFTAPHVVVAPGTSFRYPVHVYNYEDKSGVQTISWNSCRFAVDSIFQYNYLSTGVERIDLSASVQPGLNQFEAAYADFGANPPGDSLLVMEIYFTALPDAVGVSPFLFSLNEPAPIRVEHGSITVTGPDGLVRPGDANRDAAVNQLDVLYLGLAYQAAGPDRRRRILNDTEYAPDWPLQTPASALNLRHTDPDGNGRVTAADTLVLAPNWTSGDLGPGSVDTTGGVPLYVLADTLAPDTEFRIPVYLGTPAEPANTVYGLATTLHWEGTGLVDQSVSLDFTESWLTGALTYARPALAEQRIDFALVGRDGQDRSGNGPIAWIRGRTTAEVGATLAFRLGDARLMNAAEGFFAVAPRETEVVVDNPVATLDPALASQLVLYPVPATDRLYLRTPAPLRVERLTILGVDGRVVRSQANDGPLDVGDLPAGVYLLRVRTDRGVATLRWVK
jgi:hypothetical protein